MMNTATFQDHFCHNSSLEVGQCGVYFTTNVRYRMRFVDLRYGEAGEILTASKINNEMKGTCGMGHCEISLHDCFLAFNVSISSTKSRLNPLNFERYVFGFVCLVVKLSNIGNRRLGKVLFAK